jgi:NADPH:quinone reductase
VPGSEVAGVVRTAPEGAQVQPGDRVAGLTTFVGGMADVAAVAPEMVFQLPDNISMEA